MLLHGNFEYFRPETVKEAIELAQSRGETAAFLAGGTDLVLEMKREQRSPAAIIDITRVPELHVLEVADGYLRIGTAVTFAAIASSDLIRQYAPALTQAAAEVGSPQIRSVGTLGGNVATASAAGDSLPALVAYDCGMLIDGPSGARTDTVASFLQNRAAALQPGELIREIRVPVSNGRQDGAFIKLGRRNALAVARISAALAVRWAPGGSIEAARLVLGAVAPAPLRVSEAERLIEDAGVGAQVRMKVADLTAAAVARSIPGRSSAPYKRRAVRSLVFETMEKVNLGRSD